MGLTLLAILNLLGGFLLVGAAGLVCGGRRELVEEFTDVWSV